MSASAPIVGAYYRPPAKVILDLLPGQTPLFIRLEPNNPHDENAIAVMIETDELTRLCSAPHFADALREGCSRYGIDLDEVLLQPAVHLGYIPKETAAQLAPALRQHIATATADVDWRAALGEFPAFFSFGPTGAAQVSFKKGE